MSSGVKISELVAASTFTGGEVLPVVQSSRTVKATAEQVLSYVESNINQVGQNTSGNTWAGSGAMAALTSGSSNTAFGSGALASYTTDTYSDAFGYRALVNATGHANAAFGAGAGGSVTSGYDNVFVGADCGRNADDSGYLTGWNNVGVGVHALGHVTSGTHNVAIGNYALVGGGHYTGHPTALLTGGANVAIGHLALGTAYGAAEENVAIGYTAGSGLTTGTQNIFIGPYAGRYQTTGALNILIGRDVSATTTTSSNQLNIGNLITATGLGQGSAGSTGNLGLGMPLGTAPSKPLHVYNASGPTLRLDSGQGGGAYYSDIQQLTSGVLNISVNGGYLNVAGAAVATGGMTLGTATFPLTMKTEDANGGSITFGAVSGAAPNTRVQMALSRGTIASPSAVQNGDVMAWPLDIRGWDGSAYTQSAALSATVGGSVSSGVVPGYLVFWTANSSGSLTAALTLDALQGATIGGTLYGNASQFAGNMAQTSGSTFYLGTAGGTSEALTFTPSPALTAYTRGATYLCEATAANTTTTPTVNISGLGAKTIVKRASTALAASDIVNGKPLQFFYNGTNMVLMNPAAL